MSITPTQFCTTIDATSTDVTGVLNKFMKKKIQLQRLSLLMYTAGLQIPIPNIANLLPMSLIDFQFYNQLRYACPMLGLPAQTPSSLAELQSQVRSAYEQLQNGLTGHPFKQLGGLQDQLNDILGSVEGLLSNVGFNGNIFACLQSACQSTSQLGVYTDQFQQNTLTSFQTMYEELGPNYGKVLTDTTEQSLQLVDATIAGIGLKLNQ